MKKLLCVILAVLLFAGCSLIDATRRQLLGTPPAKPAAVNATAPVVQPAAPKPITPAHLELMGGATSAPGTSITAPGPMAGHTGLINQRALSDEVKQFLTGLQSYQQQQLDQAKFIFNSLKNASSRVIAARSYFYLGKIWRAEQDLVRAREHFEYVAQYLGYSSVSLLALGELVTLYRDLQLPELALRAQQTLEQY